MSHSPDPIVSESRSVIESSRDQLTRLCEQQAQIRAAIEASRRLLAHPYLPTLNEPPPAIEAERTASPSDPCQPSQSCRDRAEDMRAFANNVQDGAVKTLLREIAESYDRSAAM